ncbi:MAG: SRPBCC family protein [FCB group bacterium]|nr:SRPBCC family protein [FCB group bacterium]MBL7028340.1 SRPBCC family protein [Candidatus Neomarinimicrobiota bacterium]MBL7121659.1 SRPBCC family protein [Candidatus Neomarinimicrobiota bacterium]
MKYTVELDINLPIDRVIDLFDSTENMYKWMEGLQSFEPLEGTPGEVGAKSKMVFLSGKREIEMIETITVKNLPNEFSGNYVAKGVYNLVKNRFESRGKNQTRYITEQEFQFTGFMKYLAFFMPGAFKKQSLQHMKAFKKFAECQIAE